MSSVWKQNLGWVSALLGIPTTAIVTWVFAAGEVSGEIKLNKSTLDRHESLIQKHEIQLAVQQEQYKQIMESLREIKSLVKGKE